MSRVSGGLPPFSPVFHWLLDRNPSPNAIALFVHLHRLSDWETGAVEVPMQDLAVALRFSKRDSVRPYLEELVELGALEIREQRDPTTGGRTANEYVLALTPARSSGQGGARSTGQAPARSSGRLPISPDALPEETRETSLPGLEQPSTGKATKPRGPVRPDVERLAALLVEKLGELKVSARVDATTRKTIERLLDRPDTTEAEVAHVIRWSFSEDSWWRGRLTSVAQWARKFEDVRARMLTAGPGEALTPDQGSVGSPDLAVYFSGSYGQQQRETLFLSRSIDPSRFWDEGRDQEALLKRALASPVVYPVGSAEHHELLLAWQFRGEGQTLRGAVAAWEPVRV